MPCRNSACMSFHLKMTGMSCTDHARVKVPSFQKVTFFLQYEIFYRDAIHLYFCLYENISDCHDERRNTLKMIRFNQTPLFCYIIA